MLSRSGRRAGAGLRRLKRALPVLPTLTALAALAAVGQAGAGDYQFGELKAGVHGGLSYGMGIRTSDPDPDLLFVNNAPRTGLSSPNAAGRNQDDGNLNFRKGDVYSNVVKGFADITLQRERVKALLRIQAWNDFKLADDALPWGNTPNGLRGDQPLSDGGARARGKFSNAIVSNAQIEAGFDPAGLPTTIVFGLMNIGWRGNGMAPGPLSVLDPVDAPARLRPGAFAEEGSIPIPALRFNLKPTQAVTLDAFYQLGFVANQSVLCGTFFAAADRTLDGCDKSMVNAGAGVLSDRELLAAGRYVSLSSINEPGGSGQFGLSGRWNVTPKTDIGLAFARYHSRSPYTNMVKSTIAGANPFLPNDPRSPSTQVVYPKGIEILALDFKTLLDKTQMYGSWGYSPNQPLAYPGGEVFQAFVAPNTTANYFRAQERATPAGGVFQGWDRRKTSDVQFGATQPMGRVLGASSLVLRGEANLKYVHNLPAPNVLRYARPEVFGSGPINGVCPAGTSAVTCSNAGYVSRFAWGYQLRAVATYPKVFGQVDLRPSLGFAHNVRGTSFDGVLRQGRQTWVLGLDAVYATTLINLSVVQNNKAVYDNTRDRNFLTLSVATRF